MGFISWSCILSLSCNNSSNDNRLKLLLRSGPHCSTIWTQFSCVLWFLCSAPPEPAQFSVHPSSPLLGWISQPQHLSVCGWFMLEQPVMIHMGSKCSAAPAFMLQEADAGSPAALKTEADDLQISSVCCLFSSAALNCHFWGSKRDKKNVFYLHMKQAALLGAKNKISSEDYLWMCLRAGGRRQWKHSACFKAASISYRVLH